MLAHVLEAQLHLRKGIILEYASSRIYLSFFVARPTLSAPEVRQLKAVGVFLTVEQFELRLIASASYCVIDNF